MAIGALKIVVVSFTIQTGTPTREAKGKLSVCLFKGTPQKIVVFLFCFPLPTEKGVPTKGEGILK